MARRLVWGALVAAGVVLLARAVRAQPLARYAAEAARTATRLPPGEREARAFLRSAALAARFEFEAARLALARSANLALLAYASELVQHHEAIEPELLRLLHVRGMAPPLMDNALRKQLQRLSRLEGARFDRAFTELVVERRARDDLQLYERGLAHVADPVLQGWIERQLPKLREQQVAAERLVHGEGRRVAGESVRAVRAARPAASGQDAGR